MAQPIQNLSAVQNLRTDSSQPAPSQENIQEVFQPQRPRNFGLNFVLNILIRNSTPKNIAKGLILILIIFVALWLASNFLEQTFIQGKTPTSFGWVGDQVNEVAAPDESTYRSFYFFKKMVELAKKNVERNQSFKQYNKEKTQEQKQLFKISFSEMYGLFKVVKAVQLANNYDQFDKTQHPLIDYEEMENLTEPVDFRQYFLPPVDQDMCSSCYSFPITATIEYLYTRKTGKKVKLSEQQIISCSNPDPKVEGCNYGNITLGFMYARDKGLSRQKNYPYSSWLGVGGQCQKKITENPRNKKYKIHGYKELPYGDCRAIQYQLVLGKAVAVMIDSGYIPPNFNFSQPFRNCRNNMPNHAVTVVGQTQNQDWIIRNSWGPQWGDNGYYILKKGNTCGLCNFAMVPYFQEQQQIYTERYKELPINEDIIDQKATTTTQPDQEDDIDDIKKHTKSYQSFTKVNNQINV